MRESENYTRIYEALAKVQNEIPVMPKDCTGYGYKYTSLDTIQKTIKPILRKYGLDYIQPLDEVNGNGAITTRIYTTDGKDYVEYTTTLPVGEMAKMNSAQSMGATVTYFRRYAICSFLGILADEDIDARSFEKEQSKKAVTDKQNNDPEFKQLCVTIDQYVNAGVLKGAGLNKVKEYVNAGDKEGLKRTISWCENQTSK